MTHFKCLKVYVAPFSSTGYVGGVWDLMGSIVCVTLFVLLLCAALCVDLWLDLCDVRIDTNTFTHLKCTYVLAFTFMWYCCLRRCMLQQFCFVRVISVRVAQIVDK